jgi:hypothetical protein
MDQSVRPISEQPCTGIFPRPDSEVISEVNLCYSALEEEAIDSPKRTNSLTKNTQSSSFSKMKRAVKPIFKSRCIQHVRNIGESSTLPCIFA